jgi:putative endonuclease
MRSAAWIGKAGEAAVRQYLEQRGCQILAQNYRVSGGELDLIAVEGQEILFVEVKTRRVGAADSGYDAVTARKKKFLVRAAVQYCTQHVIDLQPRFDVAVVHMADGQVQEIAYLKNAFDVSDGESVGFSM